MKRTASFHPRQLPACAWCFELLTEKNAKHKYCSTACSESAAEWNRAKYWNKLGVKVNDERNGFNAADCEYPIEQPDI